MKQRVFMIHVMFAFYLYVLIKIILFKYGRIDMTFLLQQLKQGWSNPEPIIWRVQQGNLIPFDEISKTFHSMSMHGFINLFGNIVIFMPFGIFLGLLGMKKKLSCMGVFMRAFGVSLCLESAQAIFSMGSFDVDDLILNASGGLIGFIVVSLYNKFRIVVPQRFQTRATPFDGLIVRKLQD